MIGRKIHEWNTFPQHHRLIFIPTMYCIDYAITHELCHLREHNRGKAFYNSLRRGMPDWGRRKYRLYDAMVFLTLRKSGTGTGHLAYDIFEGRIEWRGRRDSNPQHPDRQSGTLTN